METRIRVAALILHEDRVLLVGTRRGRPGYLVLPGGGVECGENPLEAVEREVAEEAGLAVEAGALVAWRQLLSGDTCTLELYFTAALRQWEPLPDAEDRPLRWLPLAELPLVPHFPPQLAELCELVKAGPSGATNLGLAQLD